MGVLSSKLKPECILMDPNESEKETLYRRMINLLASQYEINNPDGLYESVLEREKMVSTCIGFGCAVPHCHSDLLDKTVFTAARLKPPLDFDTPDGEAVSLVFLMAGPEKNTGIHIKLLSKLSRLLHDPRFRDELRNASDAGEFYNILSVKDR